MHHLTVPPPWPPSGVSAIPNLARTSAIWLLPTLQISWAVIGFCQSTVTQNWHLYILRALTGFLEASSFGGTHLIRRAPSSSLPSCSFFLLKFLWLTSRRTPHARSGKLVQERRGIQACRGLVYGQLTRLHVLRLSSSRGVQKPEWCPGPCRMALALCHPWVFPSHSHSPDVVPHTSEGSCHSCKHLCGPS